MPWPQNYYPVATNELAHSNLPAAWYLGNILLNTYYDLPQTKLVVRYQNVHKKCVQG